MASFKLAGKCVRVPLLFESCIDLVFFLSILPSLLMPSGDQQQEPCAVCCRCEQVLLLDVFSHEQWEQISANMPALCAACKNGKEVTRKRKLNADSLEIYMCTGCYQHQLAGAFPRAQLHEHSYYKYMLEHSGSAWSACKRSCRCARNKAAREPCLRTVSCVCHMPRRSAPTNAKAGGGWLLRLQNLCQDLPQCSRHGPGPEPPLHELSSPGPKKSRGANLPQSCLQKKVDRGKAAWGWQETTAILSRLPPITCLRQPIALALQCEYSKIMTWAGIVIAQKIFSAAAAFREKRPASHAMPQSCCARSTQQHQAWCVSQCKLCRFSMRFTAKAL